jgi:hypothetical protein
MAHRLALPTAAIAGATSLSAQLPARTAVPRLWTIHYATAVAKYEALARWAFLYLERPDRQ